MNTRRTIARGGWIILLPVLFLLLHHHASWAAHSRRRVVVTRGNNNNNNDRSSSLYDRSITTFDPSGRLLQVEYGLAATLRGESILAAVLNDGSIVVLVSSQHASSSSSSSSSSLSPKVHRIDEHLWLFTAGLSGDSRALASHVRLYGSLQPRLLSYGEPTTVAEAAQTAATLQHELTRMGGARPLACTAIVVGMDAAAAAAAGQQQQPRLFRTDCGGIMEDCVYCVAGKASERLMGLMRDSYDRIRSSSDTVEATRELLAVARKAGAGDDDDESNIGFDLWWFRPDSRRRGNTHATCFLDVGGSESLHEMSDYLRDHDQV